MGFWAFGAVDAIPGFKLLQSHEVILNAPRCGEWQRRIQLEALRDASERSKT